MLGKRETIVSLAWLAFWGLLSTAWCGSAGHVLGPTWDESFYIQAGLKNWHEWNHRELLTQGTMPLPAEVQTLPLRLAEVWLDTDLTAAWLDWLPIARLGTLLFWWLLLWASFRLALLYGGVWAGRFAVALVACEPILLGHASLATTDVAITACLIALLAVFHGRRELPDWRGRLLLPAVWCMLAFMSKASALLFVPMSLAMVEAERQWSAGWRPRWNLAACRPVLFSLRDIAAIGVMGMVLLFAVCPRASRGLLFQIRHNLDGHGESYLREQVSPTGVWYYFPAALAIKLGLPVIILFAMILCVRPRSLNGAIWAALGLLALTPTFKVQIGIRFVLPIVVLTIIGVSAACAHWFADQESSRRRTLASGVASMLVVWCLTNACLVWPNGICYTNELFGGTSEGYRALSDSNYDWGQGIPELTDWQHRNADAPLHLWYFGTDTRAWSDSFHLVAPGDLTHGEELQRLCQGGYLAASTTLVYGYHFNTPAARYLRTLQPHSRTTTFLIYDFTQK